MSRNPPKNPISLCQQLTPDETELLDLVGRRRDRRLLEDGTDLGACAMADSPAPLPSYKATHSLVGCAPFWDPQHANS